MLEIFFKLYDFRYTPEYKSQFGEGCQVYNIKYNSTAEMYSMHVVMMS